MKRNPKFNFAPSGADRWINCPPSVELSLGFPSGKQSKFAREGDVAHGLAEIRLRWRLGLIDTDTAAVTNRKLQALELYGGTKMERFVEYYVAKCLESYTATKGKGTALVEGRFSLQHLGISSQARVDFGLVSGNTLNITDFKYGQGVKVFAKDNAQLMLYASAMLDHYDMVYDIEWVSLNVIQPRMDHIDRHEIRATDLRVWETNTVLPAIEAAHLPGGQPEAGDHCQWCPVKAKCRAFSRLATSIERFDFTDPRLLSNDELTETYRALPALSKWAKAAGEYMISEALKGRAMPGHKLVEGRSNRVWTDKERVEAVLGHEDFKKPDYITSKLKGIGDVSDLMSVDRFEEILGHLVVKRPGSPILVPESDKRDIYGLGSMDADFPD
jgi:hypothetical protein